MSQKDVHEAQESLNQLNGDNKDASAAEYLEIFEFSHGTINEEGNGPLLVKLDADPAHEFLVSDHSSYKDSRWKFDTAGHGNRNVVRFFSDVPGFNELKKQLVYYLIPQFHPYGKIRSYKSTATYGHAVDYLDIYLLNPNGLDGSRGSIQVITTQMLNNALDRARDSESLRHYSFLYFIITFWIHLSMQKLISKDYWLDVPLNKIDTKERQKSIQAKIAAESIDWKRFEESEISSLIDYALFWTKKALPGLLKIRAYLVTNGIAQKKHNAILKSHPDKELERILNTKVEGLKICGFDLSHVPHRVGTYEYISHQYTWKYHYKKALDNVMQGILVFFSLTTGLRSNELAGIKFEDINQDEIGEFSIAVTRYKTSVDPNYHGDLDRIPLPSFIGEIIKDYQKLRDMPGRLRDSLLFESALAKHTAELMNRSIQRSMQRIGILTGIDGVHPHRFRKTVAEMLISRSELNIDLIRMLFGHRTYTMTLRYIARNPYLVGAISEVMETHYAEDFINIVSSINSGGYSGVAADRIARRTLERPVLFKGTLLRITVYRYIAFLLEAGEPVFIKRTALGMYCVSNEEYSTSNLPPCLKGKSFTDGLIAPDITNCKLDCKNAVILAAATDALRKNIDFYSRLLASSPIKLSAVAKAELLHKIGVNETHLSNLAKTNYTGPPRIDMQTIHQ